MIVKLKDVCTKIGSGATPKGGKNAYKERGISLIRSQNVLDYVFTHEGLAYIDEVQASRLNNVTIKPDDVLLNITGDSVARVCIVDNSILPARINQHVCIVRADKDKILSSYILYFLQMKKSELLALASSGATRNALTKGMIENLEVDLPSLNEQKKIVSLLDFIDNKIRCNVRINRKLSEQAQAFYWSWFVSCENYGGKVPSNWRKAVLGDIAEIKTSTFKPTKEPDVVVEHYSIPALDEKHFPVFEIAESIKSNKYILTQNSVIISKLNPDTKRIWRPLCISDRPICSTEFIVFEAKNSRNKDYIYSIIDSTAFSNYLCSHVTGSTGSRQRAVPKATLDFELFIPTQEIIDEFCSFVTPLYDLIASNELENYRLAELRDSLLPKLMSGEIDVSNIKI